MEKAFGLRRSPMVSGLLTAALMAGVLCVAGAPSPGFAQSGPVQQVQSQSETEADAEERIRQGLQAILDGLGLFMRDIPRYEAPEILPNGDIIIRRINPKDGTPDWKEDDAPFSKPDSSETGGKGKTI
jgi:hypothetical protein